MKVLVIVEKNPFAHPGAASNRLLGLITGLISCGDQVDLLITGGYTNRFELESFTRSGEINDIKYKYVHQLVFESIWQKRYKEFIYDFYSWRSIKRAIKANVFRNYSERLVIWVDKSYSNQKALMKLSIAEAHKIFMEINEYPDIHKYNNSQKYFIQAFKSNIGLKYFLSKMVPRLDGLALMTKTLEGYFERLVQSKTEILHLPMTVDLSRFDDNYLNQNSGVPSTHIFTFTGSTNDKKDGLIYLIKAFGRIHKIYPNSELRIFGFWTYDTNRHLELIDEMGLQQSIKYNKPISSEEVINELCDSTVLVLPRPDSYQARGGFPTKLGEYLATAKPVIATEIGELPVYLKDEDSVFFARPGEVESLFQIMKKVIENYPLAVEVGKNGRSVAEKHFSVDVQSRRLSEFFSSLIS